MPKAKRVYYRACVQCRARKIKCDGEFQTPCSNCKLRGIECTPASDNRKKRRSAGYISELEAEVARLRRQVELTERKQPTISLPSIVPGTAPDLTSVTSPAFSGGTLPKLFASAPESNQFVRSAYSSSLAAKYPRPESFKKSYDAKPISVYGPASIFNSLPIEKHSRTNHQAELEQLNKDPVVIESIKLFFHWLYPDIHMFVPREAVLLDFFHPKLDADSSYCSKELIYSLCALGSLLSDDPGVKSRSQSFYDQARSNLLNDLDHPSIPAVQSLILLGIYDIYNGRNNAGWMLSGLGLRMGFNLGFHLNPKSWRISGQGDVAVSDLTVSIRSRIFWGCFVVDHLIGLLQGRPAILQTSDTTIQESEAFPDIDWIDEYNFPGYNKVIDISNPLRHVIQLICITEEVLHDVFLDQSNREKASNERALAHHNDQMAAWRQALPQDTLGWTRESLVDRASDPTRMMLVYYYYIVQLCVNRPFIRTSPVSEQVCQQAIGDLQVAVSTFTEKHGYRKCSILVVYATITAVSAILLHSPRLDDPAYRSAFFTFMEVLKHSAATGKLAQVSFDMIVRKLKRDDVMDYESERTRATAQPDTRMRRPAPPAAGSPTSARARADTPALAATLAATGGGGFAPATGASSALPELQKRTGDQGPRKREPGGADRAGAKPATGGRDTMVGAANAVINDHPSSYGQAVQTGMTVQPATFDELLGNDFGGPPIFMSSESTDWETLFEAFLQ